MNINSDVVLEYNPNQVYKFHIREEDEKMDSTFGWEIIAQDISYQNASDFIIYCKTTLGILYSIDQDPAKCNSFSVEELKEEYEKWLLTDVEL